MQPPSRRRFTLCRLSHHRVQRLSVCLLGLSGLVFVLALGLGLLLFSDAPLFAAENAGSQGGILVWAVHESMPSFDLHYDTSYVVAQPIALLDRHPGLLRLRMEVEANRVAHARRHDLAP